MIDIDLDELDAWIARIEAYKAEGVMIDQDHIDFCKEIRERLEYRKKNPELFKCTQKKV